MNVVLLLAATAVFTGLFVALGLPAGVLLGAMFAGIALAANGRTVKLPRWALAFAQAVLGAMLAQLLTPALFVTLRQNVLAFVAVVGSVLALALLIGVVLSRLRVLPGSAALWGSFPGAASMMVVLSEAWGADARLVAFMQYLRVLVVTLAASTIARLAGGTAARGDVPLFAPVAWGSFALTAAVMLACAVAAIRLRLRAGPMLVTMGVATALQNFAGLHVELPRWLLISAWAALGWMIGLRFTRDILQHVRRAFPRVLAGIVVLVTLCGALGLTVARLMHLDVLSGYFATSPGGADSIAILAANTDIAVSLVMAIQLGRTIVVLLAGPTLARWLAPLATPT